MKEVLPSKFGELLIRMSTFNKTKKRDASILDRWVDGVNPENASNAVPWAEKLGRSVSAWL